MGLRRPRRKATASRVGETPAVAPGPLTELADWTLISNAEGNAQDLLTAQDFVWERSGGKGARPSSLDPAVRAQKVASKPQ